MLKKNLILKFKKEYNFSIGESKKILEINNWNYDNSKKYIDKKIKKEKINFKFYSILNFNLKNKLILLKINFNSVIIKDSLILNNIFENIKDFYFLKKKIIQSISILSISLKENINLEKILIFNNKDLFFYNHKKILFCLLKYSKRIINICCHIIFKKINYLKKQKCLLSLINQNFIKDNNFKINQIIDINLVEFVFIINKKGMFFVYE